MRRSALLFLVFVLVGACACAPAESEGESGPQIESDAGSTPQEDGGSDPADSGPPADAGFDDAGNVIIPPDAGVVPADAGLPDAGLIDAGLIDAGPPDAGPPPPDSGPTCAPLADRVSISAIDVSPDSVTLNNGDYFAPKKPVILSTHAGGASVGWNSGDTVHVTRLQLNDTRGGTDFTVAGQELRGLVAHGDAHGLLIRRSGNENGEMALLRLDAAGLESWGMTLVGDNNHMTDGDRWIDSWSHEGRLAFDGVDEYAAYFGQTGNFGAASGNHQGDTLRHSDLSGSLSTGWGWGCSHSLDVRIAHNGIRFAPVCLSDCYPGKGIYLNHDDKLISNEPTGDCIGGSDARLGGLVPTTDGFFFTFGTPENRASRDVAFVHIANDNTLTPTAMAGPTFLTATDAVDESHIHLARYSQDQLLAGWKSGSDYQIAVLDEAGGILEGPVNVAAEFAERDDWATFQNGDVGWAFAWDTMSELKVVRVSACP